MQSCAYFLFVLVALAAVPGCRSSPPDQAADTPDPGRASSDLLSIRTVYLEPPAGSDAKPTRLGYLEEKVTDHDDRVYFVWDSMRRHKLGYYLDNGATYVFDPQGRHQGIGNHDHERSLQLIYKVTGKLRLAKE